jgi:hypothetical protein
MRLYKGPIDAIICRLEPEARPGFSSLAGRLDHLVGAGNGNGRGVADSIHALQKAGSQCALPRPLELEQDDDMWPPSARMTSLSSQVCVRARCCRVQPTAQMNLGESKAHVGVATQHDATWVRHVVENGNPIGGT